MTRLICLIFGAALLAPSLAHANAWGAGQSPNIDLVRIGLSFLVCIALALAAIFALKNRGRPLSLGLKTAGQRIDVRETRRIGLSTEVCRIACDGREFLIVVTPHSALLLREQDASGPETS